MEHQGATARRDKDKVLWKQGRSLGLTSCPCNTLPRTDDLTFNELCAGRARLAPVEKIHSACGE